MTSSRRTRAGTPRGGRDGTSRLGIALLLAGCLLSLYLVGFLLMAIGLWVWWREGRRGDPALRSLSASRPS